MKSSTVVTVIALFGTTFASTLVSRKEKEIPKWPSKSDVITAINKWNEDVHSVNTFLDKATFLNSEALRNAADQARKSANNEPTQLDVLANVHGLTHVAEDAVADLKEVFPTVPTSLQIIIWNSGNAANVTAQLLAINTARCCHVLPDLDVLWTNAAEAAGVTKKVKNNLIVPRPKACKDGGFHC